MSIKMENDNILMNDGNSASTAQIAMFAMDQLPEGVAFGVLAICGLSILLNAICLPVSALNFAMIAQTALLHRNLKFLLLLQSLGVAIFAMSESVRMAIKLEKSDFFAGDPCSGAMLTITLVALLFTGWVAFGLLCERILATIKCRTYEEDHRPHFRIFSFIFICFATFGCYMTAISLNTKGEMGTKKSAYTLYEVYTFLASSFVCMMILFYILEYNKRRYAKLEFLPTNQISRERLSMKYQLSENIRTSRQLLPSAIFHFCSVLFMILLYLLYYYGIMSKNAVWNSISSNSIFLLFSACNLGIQISVITMHPILNRRLRRMIAPARMASFWRRKVGQIAPLKNTEAPLNLFGNDLLNKNPDIGEYFKVLDSFWNK